MEDLSEKEQIEAIRSWWSENGRYVVSGVVIGAGLLFGWSYWNDRQGEGRLAASALYETLLAEVADTDVSAAEEAAGRLYSEFDETVYALQARLAMSRLYMDVGRDEDAAAALRELLAAESDPEMALVARLRLAKVLLYQDKPDEVVPLLDGYRETAFASRYNEALGDAYAAQGRVEEAADAYTAALADNPNTPTVDRTLIQMKLYDLPDVATSEAMEADTPEGAGIVGDDAVPESVPIGDPPARSAPADGAADEPGVSEPAEDSPDRSPDEDGG